MQNGRILALNKHTRRIISGLYSFNVKFEQRYKEMCFFFLTGRIKCISEALVYADENSISSKRLRDTLKR